MECQFHSVGKDFLLWIFVADHNMFNHIAHTSNVNSSLLNVNKMNLVCIEKVSTFDHLKDIYQVHAT